MNHMDQELRFSAGTVHVWIVPVALAVVVAVNVVFAMVHVPEMQTKPPVQAVPHLPQFELSLLRSLQVPEQLTAGDAQVHVLPTQVSNVPHALVHEPQ